MKVYFELVWALLGKMIFHWIDLLVNISQWFRWSIPRWSTCSIVSRRMGDKICQRNQSSTRIFCSNYQCSKMGSRDDQKTTTFSRWFHHEFLLRTASHGDHPQTHPPDRSLNEPQREISQSTGSQSWRPASQSTGSSLQKHQWLCCCFPASSTASQRISHGLHHQKYRETTTRFRQCLSLNWSSKASWFDSHPPPFGQHRFCIKHALANIPKTLR